MNDDDGRLGRFNLNWLVFNMGAGTDIITHGLCSLKNLQIYASNDTFS